MWSSHALVFGSFQSDTHFLRSQNGMPCFQHNHPHLLPCPNPYSATSAKEAEWILADEVRWTFKAKRNRGCRVAAQVAIFVSNAHGDTGAVSSIGDELAVIRR